MYYDLNGKKIRIPDNDIQRIMTGLKVNKEEAIAIYLDDEGKTQNAEQNALDEKAKKADISIRGQAYNFDKKKQKTQKERVRKENPTKEGIIAKLAETLNEMAEDVTIVNAGKLITFTLDGKNFKLDLVQSRTKK